MSTAVIVVSVVLSSGVAQAQQNWGALMTMWEALNDNTANNMNSISSATSSAQIDHSCFKASRDFEAAMYPLSTWIAITDGDLAAFQAAIEEYNTAYEQPYDMLYNLQNDVLCGIYAAIQVKLNEGGTQAEYDDLLDMLINASEILELATDIADELMSAQETEFAAFSALIQSDIALISQ